MSNHTVSISNSELRRLQNSTREADAKIRKFQNEMEQFKSRVRDEQQKLELQRQNNQRMINTMITSMVEANDSKLQKAGVAVSGAVRTTNNELQAKMDALRVQLGEARGNFNVLAGEFNTIRNQFNEIISAQTAVLTDKKERALFYLNELSDYLNKISQLNPQASFEREFSALKEDLRNAKINFANGDFEATMLVSQDSATDAAALLTKVVVANAELNEVKKEGLSLALDLLTKVEGYDSRYETTIEIDGEEYAFDMNQYSDGMLADIKENLVKKKEALTACDDVKAAYELFEDIVGLQEQLSSCELYAKDEFAKSLGLELTARSIQEMLEDDHFITTSGGFVNGDERANVLMNFENGVGDEVCISIVPDTDPKKPKLIVESFGASSETTKQHVLSVLNDNGYDLSDEKVDNNCHLYSDKERFSSHISQQAGKEIERTRVRNSNAVKSGTYQ